jgi:hypothetical protein
LHAVYASYGVREEDASAVVAYLMGIGAVGTIVWAGDDPGAPAAPALGAPGRQGRAPRAIGVAVADLTVSEYAGQRSLYRDTPNPPSMPWPLLPQHSPRPAVTGLEALARSLAPTLFRFFRSDGPHWP